MSANDRLFASTIQKTNELLNDLREVLGVEEPQKAYHVLRGVLHATRDRLSPDEAVEFGAQLPTLVRGFYYEGWKPSRTPIKARTKDEFLTMVLEGINVEIDELDLERAVKQTVAVLEKHITSGELHEVKYQMPEALRELFPG